MFFSYERDLLFDMYFSAIHTSHILTFLVFFSVELFFLMFEIRLRSCDLCAWHRICAKRCLPPFITLIGGRGRTLI